MKKRRWFFFSVSCFLLKTPTVQSSLCVTVMSFQVRTTALAFLKRMYEKDHLRDYVEKFALNYLQLLVHPNPPSLLFGADKDTGLDAWFL